NPDVLDDIWLHCISSKPSAPILRLYFSILQIRRAILSFASRTFETRPNHTPCVWASVIIRYRDSFHSQGTPDSPTYKLPRYRYISDRNKCYPNINYVNTFLATITRAGTLKSVHHLPKTCFTYFVNLPISRVISSNIDGRIVPRILRRSKNTRRTFGADIASLVIIARVAQCSATGSIMCLSLQAGQSSEFYLSRCGNR
ncbi:unnamed protein product, partial [Nesidiocoris tenuis]